MVNQQPALSSLQNRRDTKYCITKQKTKCPSQTMGATINNESTTTDPPSLERTAA